MKTTTDKRLFWFLKETTQIDLSDKNQLDMYVQQVMTHGNVTDIKQLFHIIGKKDLNAAFNRIKRFLPQEISRLWEKWLEDINNTASSNPQ